MAGTTQRRIRTTAWNEGAGNGADAVFEPARGTRCEAADARLAGLVGTIEREIIPRLVLAHRAASAGLPDAADTGAELGPARVAEFCVLAIRADLDVLLPYVHGLRERGVPLTRLYLDLLAPVARRLGDMWLADECDFTTVTLSLWRLQRLLHELSPSFQFDSQPLGERRRALLAALPGEQHTFGLFMVAEFFRRAGWEVIDGPAHSARELVAAVRHEWFATAGFSLSRANKADELAALIRDVRLASQNRGMSIIVGGVVFAERPGLVAEIGADGTAADGHEAVNLAEALLERCGNHGAN